MKEILQNIKKGIAIGFGFGLMLIMMGGAYAIWDYTTTVNTGDSFTASMRNALKDTVQTQSGFLVPSGQVSAFNLSSCPPGWTIADGAGGRPELRGEFIRGLDNGRGIDSGRTLGSSQISTHILVDNDANEVLGAVDFANNTLSNYGYEGSQLASNVNTHWAAATSGNQSLSSSFLRSIRPRNIALLYCVKN